MDIIGCEEGGRDILFCGESVNIGLESGRVTEGTKSIAPKLCCGIGGYSDLTGDGCCFMTMPG